MKKLSGTRWFVKRDGTERIVSAVPCAIGRPAPLVIEKSTMNDDLDKIAPVQNSHGNGRGQRVAHIVHVDHGKSNLLVLAYLTLRNHIMKENADEHD